MNRGAKSRSRGLHATAMLGASPRTITTHGRDAQSEDIRKLEALFGGSAPARSMPSTQDKRSFASPRRVNGRRPSDRSMQLDLMRQKMGEAIATSDAAAFSQAVDPFLASHELPDDVEFLRRMLYHPNNEVLCRVMGHISSLLLQKRMQATALLESTLHDVSKRQDLDARSQSCLDGMQKQIAKLKQA